MDTRDNTVVRLRPRPNLDVNRHFMCDHGRMHYRWMNRGDRIEAPLVRDGERHHATDWDQALQRLSTLVGSARRVVLLASGSASLESLGLLRRAVRKATVTAAVQVPLAADPEQPLAGVPNLALRRERAPNGLGAQWVGYTAGWDEALKAAATAELVVVLDVALTEAERSLVGTAAHLVLLGTQEGQLLPTAELVLPVTNTAEENGCFVNRDGRVQRYQQARQAPGMARPGWWVASGAGGGDAVTAAEAFDLVAREVAALSGIRHADLGLTGRMAGGTNPAGAGA
jgi:NADH-quinone oxidoreductase subunit G